MRVIALILLLAACAPPRGDAPGPIVRGTVVSVDASALPLDGDALVSVRTEAGERIVRVPSGEARCAATDVVPLDRLTAGVMIEARGAVGADGSVTPCTEAGHYLRRLGG